MVVSGGRWWVGAPATEKVRERECVYVCARARACLTQAHSSLLGFCIFPFPVPKGQTSYWEETRAAAPGNPVRPSRQRQLMDEPADMVALNGPSNTSQELHKILEPARVKFFACHYLCELLLRVVVVGLRKRRAKNRQTLSWRMAHALPQTQRLVRP